MLFAYNIVIDFMFCICSCKKLVIFLYHSKICFSNLICVNVKSDLWKGWSMTALDRSGFAFGCLEIVFLTLIGSFQSLRWLFVDSIESIIIIHKFWDRLSEFLVGSCSYETFNLNILSSNLCFIFTCIEYFQQRCT